MQFIQDFGILLILTVVIAFLVKLLKQPIIVAYVFAGLLFSLIIPEHSSSGEQIIVISELGITFLLFLMGLEFDFKNLRFLGKDLFIATTIQSAAFFILAFLLSYAFGFSRVECIFISIVFMFSSTLLVAKWVDDKKETTTLHGKLILGILIIQDVFAILALTLLNITKDGSLFNILLVPVGGIVLFGTAFLLSRYLFNTLFRIAVRYPELLFIFSLGICFFFVELAPLLGYSNTIGAFIAGIAIANTIYKTDVHSRLKPLIIFFNMLFFVGLGFQAKLDLPGSTYLFIAALCVLSFIVKPIVVYITLRMRGYDMKTAAISGLSLAQLSEFGIIIIAGGIINGQISPALGTVGIMGVVITMVLSSYMIKYDRQIYAYFEKSLIKYEKYFSARKGPGDEQHRAEDYNVIFIGYHDLDKGLFSKFEILGKKVLVVENDPANIAFLEKEMIPYVYNSVSNPYFFKDIQFANVELLVSSSIDLDDNKMVITNLKTENPKAQAIVMAKSLKDSMDLYDHGADYVIYPYFVNQQQVSVLLEDYTTDINKIITKKVQDLIKMKQLEEKRKVVEIDRFVNKITRV